MAYENLSLEVDHRMDRILLHIYTDNGTCVISYDKILNSLGIQFEKNSIECSDFNKMYRESFNKISSLVPIISNGFKIQERIS